MYININHKSIEDANKNIRTNSTVDEVGDITSTHSVYLKEIIKDIKKVNSDELKVLQNVEKNYKSEIDRSWKLYYVEHNKDKWYIKLRDFFLGYFFTSGAQEKLRKSDKTLNDFHKKLAVFEKNLMKKQEINENSGKLNNFIKNCNNELKNGLSSKNSVGMAIEANTKVNLTPGEKLQTSSKENVISFDIKKDDINEWGPNGKGDERLNDYELNNLVRYFGSHLYNLNIIKDFKQLNEKYVDCKTEEQTIDIVDKGSGVYQVTVRQQMGIYKDDKKTNEATHVMTFTTTGKITERNNKKVDYLEIDENTIKREVWM